MRILGIDPGFAIVGWGMIDSRAGKVKLISYGAILTSKDEELPDRLEKIYHDLVAVIEKYKPDQIAVEELFFNTNITTGIKVAEARGICLLAAKLAGVELYEYTPLQVKQGLTGYGRADKKQMQTMVKSILGLKENPKPDDAADALAVAITHSQTNQNMGRTKIV